MRLGSKFFGLLKVLRNYCHYLVASSGLSLRVRTRSAGNWDKNRGENRVPPSNLFGGEVILVSPHLQTSLKVPPKTVEIFILNSRANYVPIHQVLIPTAPPSRR